MALQDAMSNNSLRSWKICAKPNNTINTIHHQVIISNLSIIPEFVLPPELIGYKVSTKSSDSTKLKHWFCKNGGKQYIEINTRFLWYICC